MIRRNTLVLGLGLVCIAAIGLVGTPASAGWNQKQVHKTVVIGHGPNQFHGFNQDLHFNTNRHVHVQRQIFVTHVDYQVLVREPSHYGDYRWHVVDSFGTHYRAQQHASFLASRHASDYDFDVKVVQHNW